MQMELVVIRELWPKLLNGSFYQFLVQFTTATASMMIHYYIKHVSLIFNLQ